MKHLSTALVLLLIAAFATGCSEDGLTSALDDDPALAHALEKQETPRVLLRNPNARPHASGEFSSPLFGLAAAPNGDLLVADAGAGIANRYGATEIALPGVSDVAPIGRGALWATTGGTGEPINVGQALYRLSQGRARKVADLYAFEAANNPDGGEVNSNPFDVASLGGNAALVADAAANALLRVNNQGDVEVVATFPVELVSTANIKALFGCPAGPPDFCDLPDMIPAEAVPTSVAVGPDGYYYVGELKGFPAPTNASNVWRIAPGTSGAECGSSPECEKVFDGGFTSIFDLAFDDAGALHVLELDEDSWFALEIGGGSGGTINACDIDAGSCDVVATGLPLPTAIAFGTDGALWTTQNALIPGLADVVPVP